MVGRKDAGAPSTLEGAVFTLLFAMVHNSEPPGWLGYLLLVVEGMRRLPSAHSHSFDRLAACVLLLE